MGSSPGNRMHRDLENVDNLLKFLSIPDRKLSKATRLGKYDPDKGATRGLLIHTENQISRDLMLKLAYKLKTFDLFPDPINISRELSTEDAKKHNECLKMRREPLNDPTHQYTSREIRIRNLKVEIYNNRK